MNGHRNEIEIPRSIWLCKKDRIVYYVWMYDVSGECFVKRTQLWNHSTSKKRQPTSRGRKAETTDYYITSMHWAPSTALPTIFLDLWLLHTDIFLFFLVSLFERSLLQKILSFPSRLDSNYYNRGAKHTTKKKPSKSPLSSPATHIIPKKKNCI